MSRSGTRTIVEAALALALALGAAAGVAAPESSAMADGEQGPAVQETAAAAPSALPPTLEDRVFQVFLDDREVGSHVYRFEGTPEDFHVESSADFEVKIAFVTVFSYEHEAREHWVDGCMVSLASDTDTKEDFRVRAERSPGGFAVDAGDGGQTYDVDCPWGFAYWNPAMRDRSRLINAQDGRLLDVACSELAPRPLSVGGRSVRANAWSLTGEKLELTLYYDQQDRWIGLDSAVQGGRTLRYRPHPSDPFYPG
ncbi:MAG: DUF6134 family protein [Pseudomonadales bacterium]|jgi:hypothetical protein|nr:DUF6134 family protein [Pseudomonadales bacterium]